MHQSLNKTIFAGAYGNILESYDFSIYAFLAPFLSRIFFPNNHPSVALLLTFGIFALSFLIRPLGGIIFGYFGDKIGRKKTLQLSIILMSIPTLLLGLLPNYATIGILAPVLLTLLRLLQGIAISGELATSMSYLIEHAPPHRRGFVGSLALCTACCGGVIGSAIVALLSYYLSSQQLMDFGWRIPFIVGGGLGLLGLYLRVCFPFQETSLFKQVKPTTFSFWQHYRHLDYKPIITAMALSGIMAMSFYLYMAYFDSLLINTLGHLSHPILILHFVSQLFLAFLMPYFGWLSDKLGRKPVFRLGLVGLLLGSYPVFYCFQQSLFWVWLGELSFIILIAPLVALLPTLLAEMFHVQTRNSSIALGYNLGQAIFGGTAPLIALSLTNHSGTLYAPAIYLMIASCVALSALLRVKESYQKILT